LRSNSFFILGTAQIGLPYGVANRSGKPGIERSFEIISAALDEGVNCFDTSCLYGESEELLGRFFSEGHGSGFPDPLFMTKMPGVGASGCVGEELRRMIAGYVHDSRNRLGCERISFYLMHDPADLYYRGGEAVRMLTLLKREGVIDSLGVSVYHPEDAVSAVEMSEIDCVQIPLNLFDHRFMRGGLLERIAGAGKRVFVRSVFLQGLFFLDPSGLPLHFKKAAPFIAGLRELCAENSCGVTELALNFVRSVQGISGCVIGAEDPEQVRQDSAILNKAGDGKDIISAVKARFKNIPDDLILPYLWQTEGSYEK
jgi:aryl-alcohol dehydrogenase-like predicted oxidoreductase